MNIVNAIKQSQQSSKNIPLILVVNSLIFKLDSDESSKLLDKDRNDLFSLAHLFYSLTDKQKQKECLHNIANILEIYSGGDNTILDIETELSKLAGI